MTTPGGGFALADAFVRIRPTATGFRAEAEAQIKTQMAGIDPTVKIGASTAAAQIKIAGVKALLSDLTKKVYAARLSTEDTRFQAELAKDMALLTAITKASGKAKISLEGAQKMEAQLLGLASQLQGISTEIYMAHVRMDEGNLQGRLALLITQLTALGSKAYQVKVQADPGAQAAIERIIAEIGQLQDRVNRFDFDLIDPAVLSKAEQNFRDLDKEIGGVLPAAINRARTGFLGFWNVLGRNVPLFGGLLGAAGLVGVWHLVADAIIEAAAVLIPAGIAFAAFAAGAVDAVQHIFLHMQALNTVTSAFGQKILPLAKGGISALEQSITPRVFTLFGEAVTAGNAKLKDFSSLAVGAGNVMTQLGARIEQAVTSSSFTVFLHNAVADLAKIGDVIGNVFGIIGNLLKAMSGAAGVLLDAIDVLTKAIENFTSLRVVQFLGSWVIGLHAFWLWVGLAATGVAYMIPVLARLTGGLSLMTQNASGVERIKLAARDLGQNLGVLSGGTRGLIPTLKQWGSDMVAAGRATEETAGRSKLLAFAMGVLGKVPVWGWVAAGALALGGLVFWLASAKDATQNWIASLQASIDKTATWGNVLTKLTGTLATVNQAHARAAAAFNKTGQSITNTQHGLERLSFTLTPAQTKTIELTQAQKQFSGELDQTGFRLGELSRQFGGLRQGMALAVAAGIKVNDLLHGSQAVFARDIIVIHGLVQGYQNAGVAQNNLGHAVEALQITNEDQLRSVQALEQAWTTMLGIVGGGESTFITFAQDMLSANKALAQTGGTPRTVTATFNAAQNGAARAAAAALRAKESFSGLNAQSLQLRSTWQQSISAAQAYYNALSSQAAVASDGAKGQELLKRAGADLIAILGPAARASGTFRQEVYLLAQQFGLTTGEMKALIAKGQSLKANEKDLQTVNAALAKSVSNVNKDWAAMATVLGQQVKSALEAVAFKSSGAAYAAKRLYEALHNQGPASKEAHDWYLKLISDLRHAGLTLQQAKDYAAAFTKGIGFNANAIASWHVVARQLASDTINQKTLFQGITDDVAKYTTAIGNNSAKSDAGRAARRALINDLIDTGTRAGLGVTAIGKLVAAILKIPKSEALSLIMNAHGQYSVTQDRIALARYHNPGAPAAAGMRVPGSGNSDSFPAMLTPGEAVVPKRLVPHVAPFLGAHGVPGFAAGGFVASSRFARSGAYLPAAGGAGDFMYGSYLSFKDTTVNALLVATKNAMVAAQQAASAALSFHGGAAQFGGSAAAIAFARQHLPAGWSWEDLFLLWQRESGWNPYAVNKSSGAYGIPQSLGHGHPFNLGDYANQIRWGLAYIASTYGDSQNAWAHELSHGWYDRGGFLPPGLSMAWNGTGRHERVLGPGEGQTVVLEIHAGPSQLDQALAEIIRHYVRVRGGNVQAVFGRN